MSAMCAYCQQPMDVGVACTVTTYDDFADGVERDRIPKPSDDESACRDCGAPPGGLHHPGCDMERCPGCGCQAIGCDCQAIGCDCGEDERW